MTKINFRSVAKYFFSAAFSVLMIFYIFYHLFGGADNDVKTTPAILVTKSNSTMLDGYIIRDETVLYSSIEGGVNYLFENGEKVNAGATIANVYSGEGAEEVSDKILAIDKKIDILENSGVSDKATKTDSNAIDNKITEIFYLIRERMENDDTEYGIYRKDEFLTYLNKRQVITQNLTGFEDQIVTLIREKETLSGQLVNLEENIVTDSSGYFYSDVDGYENIFKASLIADMNPDTYAQLVDSDPEELSTSLTVGKLVNSDVWYIVSEISREELRKFSEGNSYDVKFPFNADTVVRMTLDKAIIDTESDKAILVLKTNVMPSGFKYLRKQNIQLVEENYTGYKIPANAVRVVDGIKGVYILNGNTVSFKEIVVLAETDGFFIVKEQPTYIEDEFYYKKLGLYDNVIVSGKNLYDGKIVNVSGGDS